MYNSESLGNSTFQKEATVSEHLECNSLPWFFTRPKLILITGKVFNCPQITAENPWLQKFHVQENCWPSLHVILKKLRQSEIWNK